MSKIKSKTLWYIGYDRLIHQDVYDGFMYSECGDIILGVVNKNRTQFSPLFLERDKPMLSCVPYVIGKHSEYFPLL